MKTLKAKILSILMVALTLITCVFSLSACKSTEEEIIEEVPEVEEPLPPPPPRTYTVNTTNGGVVSFGTKDLRVVENEKTIGATEEEALNYKKGSVTGMVLTGGPNSTFLFDEEIGVNDFNWSHNAKYDPLLSLTFTPNLNSLMKFNPYVQGNETYDIPYVYADTFNYLPYKELERLDIVLYDAVDSTKFLRLILTTASAYEENRYTYTGYIGFQNEKATGDESNVMFYNRNGMVDDNVTNKSFFCPIAFSGTNATPFSLCVANNNLYVCDYGKIEGSNHAVVRNLKNHIPSGKFKVSIEFKGFVDAGKNIYIYKGYGINCSKVVQQVPTETSVVVSNFAGGKIEFPVEN